MLHAVEGAEANDEGKNVMHLSIPFFIAKKGTSRGAKHGKSQEQVNHFKANESRRHAIKKGFLSILESFQNDKLYRMYILEPTPIGRQIVHGLAERTFTIRK